MIITTTYNLKKNHYTIKHHRLSPQAVSILNESKAQNSQALFINTSINIYYTTIRYQ